MAQKRSKAGMPDSLRRLHRGEEVLRDKVEEILSALPQLYQHLNVTERVMDILDILRRFESEDEDFKVLQALGIRSFNGLAASVKLALSGYSQVAALVLRDVLETSFLIDLLGVDRTQIAKWRIAGRRTRQREFSAFRIREQLDERDGFTGMKRAEHYRLLSELAGHASMESLAMLRPTGMDIQIGPFIDATVVKAVLSEMAKIAVHLGDIVDGLLPAGWETAGPVRAAYRDQRLSWLQRFYSTAPDHE